MVFQRVSNSQMLRCFSRHVVAILYQNSNNNNNNNLVLHCKVMSPYQSYDDYGSVGVVQDIIAAG